MSGPPYTIYRIAETGLPRDHHAIFVETNEDGLETGRWFHVTGNIQDGMAYEERASDKPDLSPTFVGKENMGVVQQKSYSDVSRICRNVPVPKKQFDGPKRLYPDEAIRRCQEWVAEAIKELGEAGVLQKVGLWTFYFE